MLALSLAFTIAGSTCLPSFAVSNIAEADDLLIQSKFKQAEEAYRGLITDDETGDAYAGLAVSLAKQSSSPTKIVEAEKIVKKAKEKFADNPNVKASGGFVAFVHSGSVASPAKRDLYLEAAEKLSNMAIKDNPDIVIAQQTLGMVKLAQDDPEGAIEPFRKAMTLAQDDAENITNLATALLRIDKKDKEGEELVVKAIKLKSDYWPARLQRAIVLNQQGKPEDAFLELKGIPKTERNGLWSQIEGDIYRQQGDGPAALQSWRASIAQDPHNPEPYRHMAEYYAIRGDGELAIAEMHNALEILPNDMNLRNQLAELALRQDKLDVAETEFRTILATKPDDPEALLGLSRVYFRKARRDGQYPMGWQQLMDQLQSVVTEQSVRGSMVKNGAKNLKENIALNEGAKAMSQGRYKEARGHYGEVINAHRDEPYELLTLGEQCFNDGDLKAAEQAFTYAKELPEVAPRAEQGISKINTQRNEAIRHTQLGDAAMKRKIPEIAQDHYKQALIADPEFASAHYGMFLLFSRTEAANADKAEEFANSFLETAEDNNPNRKEVEDWLSKARKKHDKGKSK